MSLNVKKDTVVYQIYPRSYKDTNGDGVGDLRGIIESLDYIASLGVNAIWLSPIYESPNDDNGYDISNYKAIHPEFGTMEDFDELVAEAKKRGIGIVMDLVINHTSDEHEWFKRALAGEEKYRDYYIIRKGKNGKLPNNWGNFFAECPWAKFGDSEDEYYLHLFSKKQPDLNWHNPDVLEEVKDIMRFWLDRGVVGFRCDVINIIYKDSLEDGKKQLVLTGQEHYLSKQGCHDILNTLRREVLEPYGAWSVGETVFVSTAQARDLCDESRGAAVLNESKYGVSVEGDEIALTLLRAATCPDLSADKGEHEFAYSYYVWDGTFMQSDVVRKGYEMNAPVTSVKGSAKAHSLMHVDAENVIIDTVKLSEDGSGDMIIRLYESKHADTTARLTLGFELAQAHICDMLENPIERLIPSGGALEMHMRAFEVKTVRIRKK